MSVCVNRPKRGERGYDAGKKIKGRKRHIAVDVTGHIIACDVHSAGVQDRDGARGILSQISRINRIENVLADGGYGGKLQQWFHRENKGNKRLSISKKLAKKISRLFLNAGLLNAPSLGWDISADSLKTMKLTLLLLSLDYSLLILSFFLNNSHLPRVLL